MPQLILRKQDQKPRYLSPVALADGPDDILTLIYLTGYADTTRVQVYRVKPDGKATLLRDIQTGQGPSSKEDTCTAVRRGRDLVVYFSSHVGDPIAVLEREIVPNVFMF